MSKQLPEDTLPETGPPPLLAVVPRDRKEVYATFGNPGSARLDKSWERANMVVFSHQALPKGKLYIHHLATERLQAALDEAAEAEAGSYISRIGCFSFRHQRHNPHLPLSYHSWGIAVDINPADNRVRRYKRGEAPEPFSEEWGELWPNGVPQELVEAFEAAGWLWGGRWETFVDPMHFQLVGRRKR